MSFLRFVFTGVYSKETGSWLPVLGDTPRPMPQELHQLCVDLWYVSPSLPFSVPSAPGACPALPGSSSGCSAIGVGMLLILPTHPQPRATRG